MKAIVEGDRITLVLPLLSLVKGTEGPTISAVGETPAIIAFDPNEVIENVTLDYECTVTKTEVTVADTKKVNAAIQECGYVSGSKRDIASMYCPTSPELNAQFDELERLQTVKEELVSTQHFDEAAEILQKQDLLREQIAGTIKASRGTCLLEAAVDA